MTGYPPTPIVRWDADDAAKLRFDGVAPVVNSCTMDLWTWEGVGGAEDRRAIVVRLWTPGGDVIASLEVPEESLRRVLEGAPPQQGERPPQPGPSSRAEGIEKATGPVFRAAMAVSLDDAAALVDALGRKAAMLPYLDPTSFLRGAGDVLAVAERMARAFLAFRRELERIRENAGPDFAVKMAAAFARVVAARGEAE